MMIPGKSGGGVNWYRHEVSGRANRPRFRLTASALVCLLVLTGCATTDELDLRTNVPTPSPTPSPTPTLPTGTPRPIVRESACTDPASVWTTTDPSFPELHIIGVHDSGFVANSVNVRIDRPGPVVLVVSAHDPETWNVTVGTATVLQRVIHDGYDDQTVNAPAGVTITDRSGVEKITSGVFDWGDPDATLLVSTVETMTGLQLLSFTGCHDSVSFRLSETP